MTPETGSKIAYLICMVVISITVVGYFIGLQSPMQQQADTNPHALHPKTDLQAAHGDIITARAYREMNQTSRQQRTWRTSLSDLKTGVDPLAEIKISPAQKSFALSMREQNRAFNGAPPTIPHPVDPVSTRACMVCHGEGIKTETLRTPKMSHQFLQNCTQCHVEQSPRHTSPTEFRENTFVGLAAPTGGHRAYPGAPPVIPHSTWMRVECMSCHGTSGLHGIRSTHPWRKNCLQCHEPSAELDQIELQTEPNFLTPLNIEQ